MGKVRNEAHHHSHPINNNIQVSAMKSVKKSVKITYVSRPVLVRACDATEFRAVVQELTGKDSDHEVQITDPPGNNEPRHGVLEATMAAESDAFDHGHGPCYYNTLVDSHSLELHIDAAYECKHVAYNDVSVLQSPTDSRFFAQQ